MQVIIQSLGFKASGQLEQYIQEKMDQLKPSEQITRSNVVLFLGPDRATPNTYCEIRLEIPGNDLFVKEGAAGFEQAFDSAYNKIEAGWRKIKDKQKDRHRGRVHGLEDGVQG